MIGVERLTKGARFASLAAAACVAAAAPARAETEPVSAQVAIVERGTFFKVEDLHFGVVIPSALPGVITLAPLG